MKVMPYGAHKYDVWINVCITVFLGNVRANERGNFPWFPRSFDFRSRAKTSLFQTIKVKY